MSAECAPLELMGKARADLGRVKESLLAPTPPILGSATPLLAETADRLQQVRKYLDTTESEANVTDTESRRHLQSLAAELTRDLGDVRKLVEQASEFYLGWAGILLSASGSYTATGEATPPPGRPSLSVRG